MPHLYMDDVRKTHDAKLGAMGAKGEHPSVRAERIFQEKAATSSVTEPHKIEQWMKGTKVS